MSPEALLCIMLYGLIGAASTISYWRYRGGSPLFWFPLFLGLMAIGTFTLLDFHLDSDVTYAMMFFAAIISFLIGSSAVMGTGEGRHWVIFFAHRVSSPSLSGERVFVISVLLVSVIVTIAYYVAVGYNLLFMLLQGDLTADYSDLRLRTYSGDEYFAPGYVNQFKNVLLPISAFAVGQWIRESGQRLVFIAYCVVAGVFVLGALAGTGQRGYLFYTAAAIAFGLALHGTGRRGVIKPQQVALMVVPALAVFFVMTAAYTGAGGGGASEVFGHILARFVSIQQEGALVAFRYVYLLDTAWFSEWLLGLKGLLPGEEGSRLAHEVHAVMYGTDRGTVPLASVGSGYHNGGALGVVLLFGGLGVIYATLYARFLKGRRNLLRSLSYGVIFFYCSMYVTDAPITLIDNGVLTVGLFLAVCHVLHNRDVRSLQSQSAYAR